MPKKVLKIITHIPAITRWIKIDNTFTIPMSQKTVKDLAAKLLEVSEDVEVELNFSTGKEAAVEFKFEIKGKKQPEPEKPEILNSNL